MGIAIPAFFSSAVSASLSACRCSSDRSRYLSHAPRSEIVDTYRYLGSLVADGSLSVPVEATYRLDDYRRALEHAGAAKRGGKVLFAFDQPQ